MGNLFAGELSNRVVTDGLNKFSKFLPEMNHSAGGLSVPENWALTFLSKNLLLWYTPWKFNMALDNEAIPKVK